MGPLGSSQQAEGLTALIDTAAWVLRPQGHRPVLGGSGHRVQCCLAESEQFLSLSLFAVG